MAIYNVHSLYSRIAEILNDGYTFIDIFELEGDEDCPAALSFSAIEEDEYGGGIEYEPVDAYNLETAQTCEISPSDFCSELLFTYEEISLLKCAIDNSLEYFKELSANSDTPRDERDELRQISTRMRNLQAKFAKSLKKFVRK